LHGISHGYVAVRAMGKICVRFASRYERAIRGHPRVRHERDKENDLSQAFPIDKPPTNEILIAQALQRTLRLGKNVVSLTIFHVGDTRVPVVSIPTWSVCYCGRFDRRISEGWPVGLNSEGRLRSISGRRWIRVAGLRYGGPDLKS
jgi:hypothetical protein